VRRAQPAPESLRVEPDGADLRLTWDAGVGPYGVYRSLDDPAGLVAAGNYIGVTFETAFAEEPPALLAGQILYYRVDESPRCNRDSACDNGNLCDGAETCPNRVCLPGVPVNCNDGDACTRDSCARATGACSSVPLDCDDGDACTLDACVAGLGCRSTVDPAAGVGTSADLAGNPLAAYPGFEFARTFNDDAGASLAVDPTLAPDLIGRTCDVYVLDERPALGWCNDRSLTDVRGTPDTRTFLAGAIADNTFPLIAPGQLSGDNGAAIGRGFDVVLDCDRDGQLDADERVDGLSDTAGLYLIDDLTAPGPFATNQFDEIGPAPNYCSSFFNGGLDDLRVYYPAPLDDPGFGGRFPLAVISHGNGHCFDWYDFLGTHLASYGYIVMAHDNDTRPGIETASTTTLRATDRILVEQDILGGGVLSGHIDGSRIAWIGHSRGGEGIVRAYDRLVDDGYVAQRYTAPDIRVLVSIAPTDFLGAAGADPHDVPFHLLYGAADGDVCGCPNSLYPFAVLERARGDRHSTYVHGADHNDFNCCGVDDFAGPPGTAIGRAEAQQVQKAMVLATLERYVEGRVASEDLFWRPSESLRPIGVAPTTTLVREYRKGPAGRSFVIDDFQTETSMVVSSSGGAVDMTVVDPVEANLSETDGQFAWTGLETTNGMTRASGADFHRGLVFEYGPTDDAYVEFEIVPGERDWTDDRILSFRAAQGTRHPRTAATLGPLAFAVTVVDGSGASSTIRIDATGGGVSEPYQRGGYGAGLGWQNEFQTFRIRLADFLAGGVTLDLADVRFLRFEFGPSFGDAEGRVALDDVELTEE